MVQVNIHEAKTHFSRLLKRVAAGEEITIAHAGRPIARLCPIRDKSKSVVLGQDEGVFVLPQDWDAPLPEDVLATFES